VVLVVAIDEDVVSTPTLERVVAVPAEQQVRARIADDGVVEG